MSTIKWYGAFALAVSCVVAAMVLGTSSVFSARADDTQVVEQAPTRTQAGSARVARIARTVSSLPTSLVEATRVAEAAAHGRAFDVQLERDAGRWCYEVATLVAGQPPRILEVSVDARTGVVCEIEEEDDDDEVEDDDDEE